MPLLDIIARGGQFKEPNLLGQYADAQTIQQGMQQNALNQLKMDEMRRGIDEQNRLRAAYAGITDYNDPASLNKLGAISPKAALDLGEFQRKNIETKTKTMKEGADAVATALKNSRVALDGVATPEQYMQWHIANHSDPVLGEWLKQRGSTPEKSMSQIQEAMKTPGGFDQLLRMSKIGAEKAMEQHFGSIDNGQTVTQFAVPKYGQGIAPTVLASQQKQMTPGAAEANDIARGNLRVNEGRLRLAEDAARNKVSVADTKKQEGVQQLDDIVASLNSQYDALERGGGIVSTDKGTLSNLTASAEASGIGQYVGKMLGTQNQSARNQIGMTRPQLLMAIKNASGMTARQLDSNADLKLWLQAATDPQLDVQANRAALNNIVKFIGQRNASPTAAASSTEKTAAPPANEVSEALKWAKANPSNEDAKRIIREFGGR